MSPLVGRVRRHEGFVRLTHPDGRATRYPISVAFAYHAKGRGGVAAGAGVPSVGVAYAVTHRSGSAVTRNRVRRRLRSAVGAAAAQGPLPQGLYLVRYLVRADPAAKELEFGPLCRAVSQAMGTAAARAGGAPERDVAERDGAERDGAERDGASR